MSISDAFEEIVNPTNRIDSSFFQKEYLSLPRYQSTIGDIAIVRSGTTPPDRDDNLKEGAFLLKTVDIRNRPLSSADAESFYRISVEIADRMKKTRLEARDVLINIVGATTDVVGRVALIPKDFPESNITQAMALLRITNKAWSAETVFSFLAGRYGQLQVRRLARPTGQYNLNLAEIESICIPEFSKDFNKAIKSIVERSSELRETSTSQLIDADLILSTELGLNTWRAPETLCYVRSSSDVFAALRLDAEHFQPCFRELVDLIDASGSGIRLGDFLLENKRGKQPTYESAGLPVINSKQVLRNEVRLDDDNRCGSAEDAGVLIREGDVLVNGTGAGTIGRSAAFLHKVPALPDNHVTILRPKPSLDPVYLAVFLNSKAGQMQVEQRLRGSSGQIELYPTDLAEFRIWLAPMPIQQAIRSQVEKSFKQRQEALRLLDTAKHAVEIAIERGEVDAFTYIVENS